jgi:hypothetical protein
VFLFIAVLSVFIADFTVGCGGGGYVYGPVSQKIQGTDQSYKVVVNGTPYEVPASFYSRVQIGDNVRFDGKEWSIVKPGQTNVPATVPPTSP